MMTVNEWLKANNKEMEDMDICIFDEHGMCPYDDEDVDKYYNIKPIKVWFLDDGYCMMCQFSDKDVYGK